MAAPVASIPNALGSDERDAYSDLREGVIDAIWRLAAGTAAGRLIRRALPPCTAGGGTGGVIVLADGSSRLICVRALAFFFGLLWTAPRMLLRPGVEGEDLIFLSTCCAGVEGRSTNPVLGATGKNSSAAAEGRFRLPVCDTDEVARLDEYLAAEMAPYGELVALDVRGPWSGDEESNADSSEPLDTRGLATTDCR